MRGLPVKKYLKPILFLLFLVTLLAGCATEDRPFTLVSADNNAAPTPAPDTSGSATPAPQGCVVNFIGQLQLQVSADGVGDIVGTRFINIDPIPIVFDGANASLNGADFPDIKPFIGDNPKADLIINGDIPDNIGTGIFDPETGKLEISNFKFKVQVFLPNSDTLLDTLTNVPPVTITTDSAQSAQGNGPTPEISVDGKPYDKNDGSIILVTALTLPKPLSDVTELDDAIGGGALTAVFKGTLDQDPASCIEGGGSPGTGGSSGPVDLSVSAGNEDGVTEINFGSTQALVTDLHGKTILDCSEAGNRGSKTLQVKIANSGLEDREIHLLRAGDADGDAKDPLCSGKSEFVRGSITTHGKATCQTVKVAGKSFLGEECVIPSDPDSFLTFPLMYVPYNFTAAPEGAPAVADKGNLVIEYDDGKSFTLPLSGTTEPDVRDVLSVSKRNGDGQVSNKKIRNEGVLSISLDTAQPFTQNLVLQNASGETWEDVSLELETGDVFSIKDPPAAPLTLDPQSDAGTPGQLEFSLEFNPTAGQDIFNDKLIIKMVKAGSKTADTPDGAQTTIEISLTGTVGIPRLTGKVTFQIDFLTGLIAYQVPSLVESLDFRDFLDQAPPPQTINFNPIDADSQELEFLPVPFEPLNSTKDERRKSLRILNAQGSGLKPGDDASLCQEPDPINVPYQEGDCAYFYFNISADSSSPGYYDEETRDLVLPNLTLEVQNPYHGQIVAWPASNPNTDPDNVLRTELKVSLTTLILDKDTNTIVGRDVNLVPDDRISASGLNLSNRGDALGKECPDDFLDDKPGEGTLKDKHPHLRCYLSTGDRYMQGRPATPRPGKDGVYDVVLVGVGQFQPGSTDPNIPFFLGSGDGSLLYIAIQGRLCAEGADCGFSQ